MNVAIVEDEQSCIDSLTSHLKRYCKEKEIALKIDSFYDGSLFLDSYEPKYDVVFMDIEMPHSNGMDVARKLRQIDKIVGLVFVTQLIQYAVQGYEVEALYYLVKPIAYPDFAFKMDKVVNIISKNQKEELSLFVDKGMSRILISDIYYLEVIRHRVVFHTVHGVTEVWNKPLKAFADQLLPRNFAQCSISFLVNLQYVNRIDGNYVLVGDKELHISRSMKKSFLNELTRVWTENGS